MSDRHGSPPRASELAPQSTFREGRFGRMFRNLPPLDSDQAALEALAESMREPADTGDDGDRAGDQQRDGPIPAGYTYLGQFIDHDITFDPVSDLQRLNDPEALHDFRTPRLDLDSLYGQGPRGSPSMFHPVIDDGRTTLLLGGSAKVPDLPRNSRDVAIIGDPRNDENRIVSQLHLLFLRFHNKVVKELRAGPPALEPDKAYEEAQRLVRWHYQWLVVHDFLERVVGKPVIDDILRGEAYVVLHGGTVCLPCFHLRFFEWRHDPFMPVEFSAAAYRFGHSMIRPDYRLNGGNQKEIPIFDLVKPDLRGSKPLAAELKIDWSFFFEVAGDDGAHLQHARKIDTLLASPLTDVPGLPPGESLALRNMMRGRALKLPSGQRVAKAMGIDPLADDELGLPAAFASGAPLWFYVLKEAEVQAGGEKLGPVGGRIVAEVLLGLLKGDPLSYVNVEPRWHPNLFASGADSRLPDLIEYVGP